jgi:hypothetical protein
MINAKVERLGYMTGGGEITHTETMEKAISGAQIAKELKEVNKRLERIEEKVNRMYEKMGWDAS